MKATEIRDRIMEWLGFTKEIDPLTGEVGFKFDHITSGTVLGALVVGGGIYKGIKYNEGTYESLVIKLGSGEGKNWWCVLFPPLCLLDEQNNLENAEYELYAKKIINNFK